MSQGKTTSQAWYNTSNHFDDRCHTVTAHLDSSTQGMEKKLTKMSLCNHRLNYMAYPMPQDPSSCLNIKTSKSLAFVINICCLFTEDDYNQSDTKRQLKTNFMFIILQLPLFNCEIIKHVTVLRPRQQCSGHGKRSPPQTLLGQSLSGFQSPPCAVSSVSL